MYKLFFKRFFDIFISLTAILLLSPVFVIITLILCITNGGKVFFVQKRPGKDEKIFSIVKFKSMNDKKDKNGVLLPDEDRITKFGLFVRRSSLDEIPQLWNVLVGQMSIIGPRPLLIRYLPLYDEQQRKRHLAKPGITGWAQVNGRNAISWKQKFEYDVWYVENISFFLDIKIFFMTFLKVVKGSGVSSGTHATMEEFLGNSNSTTP